MTSRTPRILGTLFAATLLVAACGDDDDTATTETAGDEAAEDQAADDQAGEDQAGGEETASDEAGGDEPASDEPAGDDEAAGEVEAPVREGETSLGTVLVDAEGLTLYGFTPDEGGAPTCTDACAEIWPPVFTDSPDVPDGLDPSVFSVVEHPSGKRQLAAGGWPLYLYAQDSAAGDVNGQGVGGNWFVVAPDGSLMR